MKQFIVFTVIGGNAYYICQNGEDTDFFVSSDDPNVALFSRESAKQVAKDNTNGDVTYKFKELK